MIKTDENALVCDLAETYHIYDYRRLPLTQVAVFSYGLRDNSRIKMKMSGQKVDFNTLLMANLADMVSILLWTKTKDGQKNKNRPESLVTKIQSPDKKAKDFSTFTSGKDFEKVRNELIDKLRKEDK